MKFLKSLAFALIAASAVLLAQVVEAEAPNEQRLYRAERFAVALPFNISSTINAGQRYAINSPTRGYVTGLYYVYEGPNAVSGGTAANIVAKVNGVSLTTISLTVPNNAAVLSSAMSIVSKDKASNANRVARGGVIEIAATGAPVMAGTLGGQGRIVVEVTPDYVPTRFQQ